MRRAGIAARLLTLIVAIALGVSSPAAGQIIGDFALPNLNRVGQTEPSGSPEFRLSDCDARVVAIVFIGVDCPLARLYAPRLNELARLYAARNVCVLAIDSNTSDTPRRMAEFAAETHLAFPLLADPQHRAAEVLGATRSPEAFVLDAGRTIRYRGRIDDQFVPGANRREPTRRDLIEAIEEILAGRPVSVPMTAAKGCLIEREESMGETTAAAVTYNEQIAPILARHCVECHRPGQIAPFSLTTYQAAHAWAATIREVVEQGRMPPWGADRRYGHFLNERELSDLERQQLLAWCEAGAAEGTTTSTAADEAVSSVLPLNTIGRPDCIINLPGVQTIPAEGVLEYRSVVVDPHFDQDRWISAVEIYPGNRKVLHHCTVFLSPPGQDGVLVEQGTLGSFCVATYTPGASPAIFPEGMAKLIPAGWRFVFVLHYVTTGMATTDDTSLGLKFADPKTVHKEVATKLLLDDGLAIAPGERDHVVERTWRDRARCVAAVVFPAHAFARPLVPIRRRLRRRSRGDVAERAEI